jgi:hypothetical protein
MGLETIEFNRYRFPDGREIPLSVISVSHTYSIEAPYLYLTVGNLELLDALVNKGWSRKHFAKVMGVNLTSVGNAIARIGERHFERYPERYSSNAIQPVIIQAMNVGILDPETIWGIKLMTDPRYVPSSGNYPT